MKKKTETNIMVIQLKYFMLPLKLITLYILHFLGNKKNFILKHLKLFKCIIFVWTVIIKTMNKTNIISAYNIFYSNGIVNTNLIVTKIIFILRRISVYWKQNYILHCNENILLFFSFHLIALRIKKILDENILNYKKFWILSFKI